jgi:ATP-dependent helicase/nuclease subunit B
VLLTRAARDGSAPTVPSRFWQRVLAEVTDPAGAPPLDTELAAAARLIDRPSGEPKPARRPAPCPPASARPRRLSVTEVSRLKADPFAFYARRVLRLEPLDPLDSDPTAADLGILVHAALERWATDPAVRARGVAALADEELAKLPRPELTFLWRPRLLRRIGWAAERLDALLEAGSDWQVAAAEAGGRLELGGVTLTGRADRIDRDAHGNLRITDYKTGGAPDVADVEALFDAQLPLLGTMAQEGAFRAVTPGPVTELEYWTLPGGATPGSARPALGKSADPAAVPGLIDRARDDLLDVARDYLLGERPFRSKELPAQGVAYSDYDVLARLAEWYGR